jgi:hypothetical protein
MLHNGITLLEKKVSCFAITIVVFTRYRWSGHNESAIYDRLCEGVADKPVSHIF